MLVDGKWEGAITDQHIHLDRNNRFLDAISDFVNSGGTGIMLVHKPAFSGSLPTDLDGYRDAYNDTLDMASRVRESFQIDVGVVLGPHPVVWEKQIGELGMGRSTELHLEAIGLALDLIEAGEAHCLGEVGRPHYEVGQEIWQEANENLVEVMSMAASAGVSIQLHVEDNGEETCRELSEMCLKSGLPKQRAIRHFAPPDVSANFTHGLSTTVSVGKGSVDGLANSVTQADSPWGMETDFLDDPSRPGAVLGPKTIPKRTQELCSRLISDGLEIERVEEILSNVHSKWPKSLYGV
ncbi:MAG: hypothetical protein CMA79_02820 [Euryarchaeota archaeon]|nr:hypothetical protein [Euryarchaeota archaeon]